MSLCVKADRLQNAGHQIQNSKNFLQASDKKATGNFLSLFIVEVKWNVLIKGFSLFSLKPHIYLLSLKGSCLGFRSDV